MSCGNTLRVGAQGGGDDQEPAGPEGGCIPGQIYRSGNDFSVSGSGELCYAIKFIEALGDNFNCLTTRKEI